ncbi:hypothetical protein FVR03_17980 [Pontibacter qinzhouensis]|uniref:Uncharacterized protein n=1 Tax=Pontibacter qinzhouensis TaxID=2603253 RepID=A0A5C8JFA3_9BACT|nr:hypothetical protein [Pontibacter qinzhouensis]TXK36389.1 hypothetical protein FVR03_17980 [Pontibacter qinzhouensis]
MSESSNPLFKSERELLERQKEEYKNALMGDVDHIKTQSQEIGKKVALAGGVLVAGLLLRRMFSGSKKKTKKVKAGYTEPYAPTGVPLLNGAAGPGAIPGEADVYSVPPAYAYQEQPQPKQNTGLSKSFVNSELMQVITQQLAALLMVYISKKVEEYLSSVSENTDIAVKPIEVTEIETTEYIYPEEDAL